MIRMIFIFILLLGSVWLGLQLKNDPGYVLIALNHWTIETTLWVGILAFITCLFIFHFLWSLISWLIHIPTVFSNWRTNRKARKARAKTRQGLIEFSEGHWRQAKNHLIKALPGSDAPLLNYLTAARAAQEMGDYKLRDDYLRDAQQSVPEAKIAVELTQAQLQLANQQWEQALATLKHLQDLAPHHPYVLKLLMQLYQQINDWPHLIALLPELKSYQVIPTHEYNALEREVYLQAMKDAVLHKPDPMTAINHLFATLPAQLLKDPEVIAFYSGFLMSQAEYAKAEKLLRRSLAKQFNEPLITLYGQLNEHAKLSFAESFLKEHRHSAALLLCLGRLSQNKSLWGKARSYFERSIELTPTPAAYAELGNLLQQLNDEAHACEAFRAGLLLTTRRRD